MWYSVFWLFLRDPVNWTKKGCTANSSTYDRINSGHSSRNSSWGNGNERREVKVALAETVSAFLNSSGRTLDSCSLLWFTCILRQLKWANNCSFEWPPLLGGRINRRVVYWFFHKWLFFNSLGLNNEEIGLVPKLSKKIYDQCGKHYQNKPGSSACFSKVL